MCSQSNERCVSMNGKKLVTKNFRKIKYEEKERERWRCQNLFIHRKKLPDWESYYPMPEASTIIHYTEFWGGEFWLGNFWTGHKFQIKSGNSFQSWPKLAGPHTHSQWNLSRSKKTFAARPKFIFKNHWISNSMHKHFFLHLYIYVSGPQ